MNIKINSFFLLVGMLVGAALFAVYSPKPKPEIKEVVQVKTETKVIKPNGEVTESIIWSIKEKPVPTIPKMYGVGLYHDKTIFGEIRLGKLPLFAIGEYNFKGEGRIGLKMEF